MKDISLSTILLKEKRKKKPSPQEELWCQALTGLPLSPGIFLFRTCLLSSPSFCDTGIL